MMRALALGLLALVGLQAPEIEVSAVLDRKTATVDETVHLTIHVRGPGVRTPEIESPDFVGFEVLATSDRSSFRISAAAGPVREFSREYTLRVTQAGDLTIPPVRVNAGGQLYETDPIAFRALAAGGDAAIPNDFGPISDEEVALRMWVEPETAYVGQQVTVTVAAFFDPLVRSRLQRQPEYRAPDVQGMWTADLPGPARPERRVLDGREYYVQVFRRALFPLSSGEIRIPPAAVIYEVRRGLIYAPETFQVESRPGTIRVRPLPVEGQPPDYAGAVGRYEAETRLDRSGLRAGEAVNLTLEVRGTGNLSSLARPAFPDVVGARVYEGGEEAEVQVQGTELAGRKSFSWVLVPEKPGEYVVPAIRLPYFNPDAVAYRVAVSDPVVLEVEAAALAGGGEFGPAGTIRYIKPEFGRSGMELHREPIFWSLLGIPMLLILIGLLARGWGRRGLRPPRLRPRRAGKRRLRELHRLARSGEPRFYAELRISILRWLQARLHANDLGSAGALRLQHTLEDVGVSPGDALQVIELLERCNRYRYAPEPAGDAERRDLLRQAERLLNRIDREAMSERRLKEERVGGVGVLLILLIGLVSSPARGDVPAQPPPDPGRTATAFVEAKAAYERGDFPRAVERFRAALTERPRDPNILYNLGNAYYEAGERGRAVAYWIRSLQIAPRDEDARFNLRFTLGDDPVVAEALPPVPLSSGELAWLLGLSWVLATLSLLAWWRWRRARLSVIAVGSLVLAAVAGSLLALPRSDLAVLAVPDAVLRAGPVEQSEALATPAPGTPFRIEERRRDWLRVSRGEREGWIGRQAVEILE